MENFNGRFLLPTATNFSSQSTVEKSTLRVLLFFINPGFTPYSGSVPNSYVFNISSPIWFFIAAPLSGSNSFQRFILHLQLKAMGYFFLLKALNVLIGFALFNGVGFVIYVFLSSFRLQKLSAIFKVIEASTNQNW